MLGVARGKGQTDPLEGKSKPVSVCISAKAYKSLSVTNSAGLRALAAEGVCSYPLSAALPTMSRAGSFAGSTILMRNARCVSSTAEDTPSLLLIKY